MLSAASISAQTGTWSGLLKIQNSSLLLVFNLTEGTEATMDVPDQNASDIGATVAREGFSLKITVPAINAVFDGMWTGKLITGTFTQNGMGFPLTLNPGMPKLNRPQTPIGPFPYATEDVSFTNGDATLRGTLTLPENCDRNTPVLIMITGSGLQNRDEEIYGHKPFAVIADALARNGIATLRYDDRGFAESTGDLMNATVDDFKNDALSGIAMLRGRFARVGVLGHSEGGAFALMIAAEGKADFIVSLAGLVVSMRETLLWQNRDMLLKAGLPESQTSEYVRLLDAAFEAICSGTVPPSAEGYDIPEGLKANYEMVLAQLASPYMKSSLAMDPRLILDKISCPVLALNGTKDIQVDCETNLGALEKGIKSGLRSERVAGVNHLFQHCKTGDTSEYKTIEETFSVEVLQMIADWINNIF